MFTLVLNSILPALVEYISWIQFGIFRWLDRGCKKYETLDNGDGTVNTKLIIQQDVNDLYTGYEMFAQYIYPQLFMTLWVSMMYSGGLPLIYPLTIVNFTGCFWAHKHLLINFVKRTYEFDESLVKWTLGFFKIAVIFHLFTSLAMFTNHATLGSTRFDEVSGAGLYDKMV